MKNLSSTQSLIKTSSDTLFGAGFLVGSIASFVNEQGNGSVQIATDVKDTTPNISNGTTSRIVSNKSTVVAEPIEISQAAVLNEENFKLEEEDIIMSDECIDNSDHENVEASESNIRENEIELPSEGIESKEAAIPVEGVESEWNEGSEDMLANQIVDSPQDGITNTLDSEMEELDAVEVIDVTLGFNTYLNDEIVDAIAVENNADGFVDTLYIDFDKNGVFDMRYENLSGDEGLETVTVDFLEDGFEDDTPFEIDSPVYETMDYFMPVNEYTPDAVIEQVNALDIEGFNSQDFIVGTL